MSIEHIKKLVINKYEEYKTIYKEFNENNEDNEIFIDLDIFICNLLSEYDENKVMYLISKYFYNENKIIETKHNETPKYKELKERRNDSKFIYGVKTRDKACIICNIDDCHKSSYQVCHIFDFSNCETDQEKYDINNGILLCSNMHKYLDSKLNLLNFDIIPEQTKCNSSILEHYIVKVSFNNELSSFTFYKKYNGKEIKFNKDNIFYFNKRNKFNALKNHIQA
jgi:hypothetical protein